MTPRRNMSVTLRAAAFALLRATGMPTVLRHTRQRRRLTILLFHQQSAQRFDRTLRALGRRYNVVALADALAALSAGSMSSLPPRPLAITFDDGRASNAALIDVIERHGIRPTVFVTTGLIGTKRHFWWTRVPAGQLGRLQSMPDADRIDELRRIGEDPSNEHDIPQALSVEQLSALARVADIEPHTRTHPVLTRCEPHRAAEEIRGSAEDVARLTGRAPSVFAYPNGAFSPDVARLVGEAGLPFAVTTEAVSNTPRTDPHALGRIFIRDTAGTSEVLVFASGMHAMLKRVRGHNSH